MSPTVKNTQLMNRLVEIVGNTYSEPDPPVILFDELESAMALAEAPDSQTSEKKKKAENTKFRCQAQREPKRRRVDKEAETIVLHD